MLIGELENWRIWRIGELENWRIGELENWRIGELENWRIGELENWRIGEFKINKFPNYQITKLYYLSALISLNIIYLNIITVFFFNTDNKTFFS